MLRFGALPSAHNLPHCCLPLLAGEEGFYACCGNAANPGQPWCAASLTLPPWPTASGMVHGAVWGLATACCLPHSLLKVTLPHCHSCPFPACCRTEWAAEEGQDFIQDHASPAIDFATIHAWVSGAWAGPWGGWGGAGCRPWEERVTRWIAILSRVGSRPATSGLFHQLNAAPIRARLAQLQVDNWQQVDPSWLSNWVTSHARDAATVLKKPLVMEEVSEGGRGEVCWVSFSRRWVWKAFTHAQDAVR